jgi:hypothetical protein
MTGYEAFCLYSSLKLHFSTPSYDFFKYNGKVSTSVEAFENRKDKWHFYKLSRRFNNVEQAQDFLVANFVADSNVWIGSLLHNEADITYRIRQKVIQSLTYSFTTDVTNLFRTVDGDHNEILKSYDGQYPYLLQRFLHEGMTLESMCILNSILNFLPIWDKKISDTIQYPNISRKFKKYTPFIPIDKTKYKLILRKIIDENKETVS